MAPPWQAKEPSVPYAPPAKLTRQARCDQSVITDPLGAPQTDPETALTCDFVATTELGGEDSNSGPRHAGPYGQSTQIQVRGYMTPLRAARDGATSGSVRARL